MYRYLDDGLSNSPFSITSKVSCLARFTWWAMILLETAMYYIDAINSERGYTWENKLVGLKQGKSTILFFTSSSSWTAFSLSSSSREADLWKVISEFIFSIVTSSSKAVGHLSTTQASSGSRVLLKLWADWERAAALSWKFYILNQNKGEKSQLF